MKTNTEYGSMEFGEKVLRSGVGLIMMETVFLHPGLTPTVIAGLTFAALYLVLTAIIGRDPLYLLAPRVHQADERENVSVTPIRAQHPVETITQHKKAA